VYQALHQRTVTVKVTTGERNFRMVPIQSTLDGIVLFSSSSSAVMTGVQMRCPSWVDWSDGLSHMWADSFYFLCVVFGSIWKIFASFQHFLWPWANFDFSSRPWVRMYLCSCVLLKVCLFRRYNICHNHMGCCTHTASSAGQVFINVPQNVCLVLKVLRALKRFPVRLYFSAIPFNIWDNDSTRVYWVWRTSRWFH
jgi:hypothetical protein